MIISSYLPSFLRLVLGGFFFFTTVPVTMHERELIATICTTSFVPFFGGDYLFFSSVVTALRYVRQFIPIDRNIVDGGQLDNKKGNCSLHGLNLMKACRWGKKGWVERNGEMWFRKISGGCMLISHGVFDTENR